MTGSWPRSVPGLLVVGLGLLVCSMAVPAADWRITPRVTVTETFSDNINQAADDAEEDDLVSQVTPGVGVTATGRRLSLNFDYQATALHYANDTDSSSLEHRLSGGGNAELYEDHLFLDFSATVSQRNIDNQGRVSTDIISATDNRETVATLRLSPYWVQRFGSYADAVLRYEGGALRFDQSGDTDVNDLNLSVTSGSEFVRSPWNFSASYRDEDNADGPGNTFLSASGDIRYDFSRAYGIRVRGRLEDNDVVSAREDDDISFIGLTGIWTPNRRLSLEVGAAFGTNESEGSLLFTATWEPTERTNVVANYEPDVSGSSFSLDASHTMRRAVFRVRYDDTRTTTARQVLEREILPTEDAFGDPIENPGLQQVLLPIDETNVTNETLISRRLDGDVTLRGRASSVTLSVYRDRRTFELSGGEEEVIGLRLSGSRDLSRYGTVTAGGNWQQSEFVDDTEDTLYGFDLGYSRSFGNDLRGSLRYSYTQRDSDTPANEYSENRITGSLTLLF